MNAVAAGGTVRVLVVDDSPSRANCSRMSLGGASRIQVVGMASDGEEAVREAERSSSDVILMDFHLPGMDGFAATRRIMETCPTRIVMATATSDANEVSANFRAIDAGALAVLAKPRGPGHPRFVVEAAELVRTVRVMSEVPVVRRWPRHADASSAPGRPGRPGRPGWPWPATGSSIRVSSSRAASTAPDRAEGVAVGAAERPAGADPGRAAHLRYFCEGFAQWLGDSSGYAVAGSRPTARRRARASRMSPRAEVSSAGTLTRDGRARRRGRQEHGVKPSVSVLFRSAAAAFGAAGRRGVADRHGGGRRAGTQAPGGKAEALRLRRTANRSVVFGMPGAAVALGAAQYVLPPTENRNDARRSRRP